MASLLTLVGQLTLSPSPKCDAAHAQCILANHKVKGCLYMSHKKSPDPCGAVYSVFIVFSGDVIRG